ncbi:MAG: dihydroorotate dehydrogenase electron transfer subunit [bacterium]
MSLNRRYQINARINKVENPGRDIFKIRFLAPDISRCAFPGQFVFIRVQQSGYHPLLRRAFAVAGTNRKTGEFDIIFNVVGVATSLLSSFNKGVCIDIIGPLGNSFSFPLKNQKALLVAGGCGIAPLFFLAGKLREKKIDFSVIYGSATASQLILTRELRKICPDIAFVTEDGTLGQRGVVTSYINHDNCDMIYVCGPEAMLKQTSGILKDFKGTIQVSLEPNMACGIGVCRGCAVRIRKNKGKQGLSCGCTDGPIYNCRDLIWT